MSADARVEGGPTRRVQLPSGRVPAPTRWLPVVGLVGVVAITQLRYGVHTTELLRYALYWVVAVVLPGLIVSRSLVGVRRTIVEDLAVGAVTGISVEVLAWVLGVTTGLGDRVRFWWVPVLVAGVAVPAIRRRVLVRVRERVPLPHSITLSALCGYLLVFLNVNSFVFQAPLPPGGSNTYFDMWWQLSLVQEMMKYEPPQIPQLAGEPFHYHYFANVQIASGARLSGVAPEVVTFRLWYVPVVLLSVGMAVALGRALTRSLGAGVATAGIVYGLSSISYIWPGELAELALSPLASTSPSQLLANIGLCACAFAAVLLLRGRAPRLTVLWAAVIVLGASADKSTVVPLVLAGTIVAAGRAVFVRSWRAARWLAVATVALLALQALIAGLAAGTEGARITVLGPLAFTAVFRGLVTVDALRATNHGLLLDSITSVRTACYAVLATVVVLGLHTIGLAGGAGLLRRSIRKHYVHWWLAGGALAGYAAMLCIDHVGVSQTFFGMGAGVLGTALTVSVLWEALGRLGPARRLVAGSGLIVGGAVTVLIEYVINQRKVYLGYGAIDRVVIPLIVVAAVVLTGWLVWRRHRSRSTSRWNRNGIWAFVLAAIIGVAVPGSATVFAATVAQRVDPEAPVSPPSVTSAEQRAALWLRSHSDTDDVVATNAYCLAVVTTRDCSARGFWISGLSGRRVVEEGWAYTPQAQSSQGVDGRTYDRQPSPFRERFRVNQAVFDDSSRTALDELRRRYDVRWLVSVHRAGPTPTFPSSVATQRYDNGAVTIFRVR